MELGRGDSPVSTGIVRALAELRSDNLQEAIELASSLLSLIDDDDLSAPLHRCQLSAISALAHLRLENLEEAKDIEARLSESLADTPSFHTQATQRGLDPSQAFSETLLEELRGQLDAL